MIRSLSLAVPVLVLAWLALLVGMARFTDAAPAYVVLFPDRAFVRDLPEDARVAWYRPHGITLQSEEPGLAGRLYAAGAWIVLPAGLPGCLPFTKEAGS